MVSGSALIPTYVHVRRTPILKDAPQLHSSQETYIIQEYVEKSKLISLALQMLLVLILIILIVTMWMVLVLLMEARDNISGHLLQPEMKLHLIHVPSVHVLTYIQQTPPPEFVGNDYFCDTGSSDFNSNIFYSDDPLWDGAGCGPQSTCCSFNNPPWFYKQLPQPTTDDIEMRVCRSDSTGDEDIGIEMFDIYIQ